jgi:hypothetical protein
MAPSVPSPMIVLTFGVSLLLLAWLSRQVSIHIQLPVYYLTRSNDAPALVLFLLFYPGVLIHESAHWLTARVLGLKTGRFRVWPSRQGKYIGLGSVSVQRSNAVVDSIVGLAPLVAGSILVAIISHQIFNAAGLAEALQQGQWQNAWEIFSVAFVQPDGAIWAYLLFAIANAMMPSVSDREPLKPVLLYGTLIALIYIFLGMPLTIFENILTWASPAITHLTSAFFFTILLDLMILGVLYIIRLLLSR